MDENLAFAPATELLELIATKQVSPVQLTELYFDRIEKLDSQLNSYLLLTYDEAMKQAKIDSLVKTRFEEVPAI